MKRIFEIGLVLLIISMVWGVERPPVMEPNDVPFVYEPNLCQSEIMAWTITGEQVTNIYTVAVWNEWGLSTELTVTGIPNILVQKIEKLPDAEGGWNQIFTFSFVAPTAGVHYLNMTATDYIGQSDTRTLMVLAMNNVPPILRPYSPPIITPVSIKNGQRHWQFGAKQFALGKTLQFPTMYTRILN